MRAFPYSFALFLIAALVSTLAFQPMYRKEFGLRIRNLAPLRATAADQDKRRINTDIELDKEKVVNFIDIKPGDKVSVCRCWKSKKFPLCDGAHNKHNAENGDNVAPAVITGTN
jgi:CDGSH-type Zn-finger protein